METLKSLDGRARELDTPPQVLSAWLEHLARFSAEFLAANADGPAFHGQGAGPPPRTPLPLTPEPFDAVLEEYRQSVLTRSLVPTSGRFFGYVPGGGLPSAAIGDFLAALTNPYASVYGASPGAAQIENSAIQWLIELIGYPAGAWGTLQSGGSLATLTAVVAAREARPPAERGRGAVLVRDGDALRNGFSFTSSYLSDVHQGRESSPADYSPELTRHFRGLRLWMSLKLHGIERFRAALEEKLILAQLAYERLAAIPGIETVPAPQLSCVAFRVRDPGDQATDRLLAHLLQRGRVQLSSTRLWGRLYLRLCILCFRSHRSDLEEALGEIEAAVPPGA